MLLTGIRDAEFFWVEIVGAQLHDVVLNASMAVVIGGITHDIPIIVHTCVEALLRRGDLYLFPFPNWILFPILRYLPKRTLPYSPKQTSPPGANGHI